MKMWSNSEMKDNMNKIHNCDALEFMKQVPDDYFDLVLTDPPYGLGKKGLSTQSVLMVRMLLHQRIVEVWTVITT